MRTEQAKKLALKTFSGASHLAATSSNSPTTLREQVTSKGGTTEAALNYLNTQQVKQHFINAVKAAEKRAKELDPEKRYSLCKLHSKNIKYNDKKLAKKLKCMLKLVKF